MEDDDATGATVQRVSDKLVALAKGTLSGIYHVRSRIEHSDRMWQITLLADGTTGIRRYSIRMACAIREERRRGQTAPRFTVTPLTSKVVRTQDGESRTIEQPLRFDLKAGDFEIDPHLVRLRLEDAIASLDLL